MSTVDPAKQSAVAACATCKKLKMRCARTQSGGTGPCDRCLHNGRSCFIPPAQKLGRKRGSAGRYQGVNKALRNLRLALQKADETTPTENSRIIGSVSGILNDETVTTELHADSKNTSSPQTSLVVENPYNTPDWTGHTPIIVEQQFLNNNDTQNNQDEAGDRLMRRNSTTNPLWLIADASREALSSMISHRESSRIYDTQPSPGNILNRSRYLLNISSCVPLGLQLDAQVLEEGLDTLFTKSDQRRTALEYFKFRDINHFPDTGPDFDPIEQGLVTIQEARNIFSMFVPPKYLFTTLDNLVRSYFEKIDPICCILDSKLHTFEFVRSRSALLFTWVLAITVQFDSEHSALAKRLRVHGEKLCQHIYIQGFKSTEIVQGYYIYLHTATPAPSYGEEHSGLYATYAFGLASTLYLDEPCRRMRRGIDYDVGYLSANALQPPSLIDYDLLSRNRERTWLRILAWEKANSAVCNRTDVFPENDIVRNIETWWRHPLATSTDRYTCALIALWQRAATLRSDLRRQTDINNPDPHWIARNVEDSLAFWHQCWMMQKEPATQFELISDIQLRYIYMHVRLWALSFLLSKISGKELKIKSIVQNSFKIAVDFCETVVQDLQNIGEPLYLMMTPIWAMICYAAILSLNFFPIIYGDKPGSDAQLIALLSRVALQLEQAGSTPPPRYGLAALLGQHLKMILQTKLSTLCAAPKQVAQTIEGEQSRISPDACDQIPSLSLSHNYDVDLDSMLPATYLTGEDDILQENFGDFLQEFFGQRFGQ